MEYFINLDIDQHTYHDLKSKFKLTMTSRIRWIFTETMFPTWTALCSWGMGWSWAGSGAAGAGAGGGAGVYTGAGVKPDQDP